MQLTTMFNLECIIDNDDGWDFKSGNVGFLRSRTRIWIKGKIYKNENFYA